MATTRQRNKRQEKKRQENILVFEEQLDDEVLKTDEGAEKGVLLGGRLWNTYNGLAAKITPKKVQQTIIHLRILYS